MRTSTRDRGIVTVAAIRRHKGRIHYLFNERQRIYTLPTSAKSFVTASKLLKTSLRRNTPLDITLDARRGRIERVTEPSRQALRKHHDVRAVLEAPSRPARVDVSRLEPAWNIVGYRLKWPVFQRCARIIPSYAKAKEIFDFCAKQTCSLGGPFDISPCIPFQYVIDGCYARAHKMRWIITRRYRYCCEKVFSFANQNNDTLAVKADKWGGCCVTWWYHVAPLVRVNVTIPAFGRLRRPVRLTLAMVIDPGMFDKPVLLSTWLGAQENTTCSTRANVSMYSIQPGSAYWPANYQGTQYGTDDTYSLTDGTLTAYRNLVTCP